MDPSFVMATLICLIETMHAEKIVKAPCMRTCHSVSKPSGFFFFFENPHTSDHSPGTPPGPHNGVETDGIGKFVLTNASSIMLMGRTSLPDWRRHAAPKKSPATKSTCSCKNTVVTASNKFFANQRFLSYVLLMWSDTTVKKDFPLRGILRNEAREMTACSTHPDCPLTA